MRVTQQSSCLPSPLPQPLRRDHSATRASLPGPPRWPAPAFNSHRVWPGAASSLASVLRANCSRVSDYTAARGQAATSLNVLGPISESAHIQYPQSLVQQRFGEILDCIRQGLRDPELTMSSVAAECGISTRYLCNILKAHQISFSKLKRMGRLELAFAALQSEDMHHLPASAIALTAGFKSAAHFGHMSNGF